MASRRPGVGSAPATAQIDSYVEKKRQMEERARQIKEERKGQKPDTEAQAQQRVQARQPIRADPFGRPVCAVRSRGTTSHILLRAMLHNLYASIC
jgi:hypothetical protein